MSNLNEKLKTDNSNIPKPPRTVIQVDNIPAELKAIPQWTLWKYIWKEKSWAKVPWTFYNTVAKWKSEAEDCRHPFDDVLRQFLRNNNSDGIGIFIEDTGFVGIDLDNKFGKPTIDTHIDIVSLFDSYTENTTHTEGLRILVKADASDVPESMYTSKIELPNGFGYEWYSKGRFFTVTGRHVSGSPKTINSRQVELEQFLGTYMERKNPLKTASAASTTLPPSLEVAERLDQLQAYLDACPGAIEGRNASNYCYAVVLTSLWGFDLVDYRDLVEERLIKWGERSDQSNVHGAYNPWTSNEIRHKIESALEATYNGIIGDKLHKVELLDLPEGTIIEELAKPDKKTVSTEIVDPCFEADIKKPTPTEQSGFQFKVLSSKEFNSKVYHIDWHIEGLMAKGVGTVLGGPRKGLKTNIGIDLVTSLGHGSPFLGQYKTNKARTLFLSGESGEFTIQETARRICKQKNINFDDVDAYWGFELPRLSIENDLEVLGNGVKQLGIEVVIIDPIYLCLTTGGSAKTSDMFDMGPLYKKIADTILKAGATPILFHHAVKRLSIPFQPLELEDLSHSGIQEFARQWLLINRRSAFKPGTGRHELWFSWGGSIGQGGLVGLNINEGEDFKNRIWEIDIQNLADIKEAKIEAKEAKSNNELLKVRDVIANHPDGVTAGTLETILDISRKTIDKRLLTLVETDEIVKKNGKVIGGNGALVRANFYQIKNNK